MYQRDSHREQRAGPPKMSPPWPSDLGKLFTLLLPLAPDQVTGPPGPCPRHEEKAGFQVGVRSLQPQGSTSGPACLDGTEPGVRPWVSLERHSLPPVPASAPRLRILCPLPTPPLPGASSIRSPVLRQSLYTPLSPFSLPTSLHVPPFPPPSPHLTSLFPSSPLG